MNTDTRERVLILIKQNYKSDAEFEVSAGLKPKSVYDWKRGKSESYLKMLPKLSELFRVSVDYLLTGADKTNSPVPTEAQYDDLKKVIIARSPEPLADEDAETLMKLLDSTVDSTIAAFLEARKNGRKAKRK